MDAVESDTKRRSAEAPRGPSGGHTLQIRYISENFTTWLRSVAGIPPAPHNAGFQNHWTSPGNGGCDPISA